MSNSNHLTIIDGHVHIHDRFDIKRLFQATWENFFCKSKKMGYGECFTGVLFLAEPLNKNWFSKILELAKVSQKENFDYLKYEQTKESNSLRVILDDEKELIVIAGRQIVSKENLEVLALGISEHFCEGKPVKEIVKETISRGGIPVIPWGVGKWLGKRGSIVNKLLQNGTNSNLFLGDNSGRPIFWPNPSQFKKAKTNNIPILPGSDPLPFPSEFKKVGSFGFILHTAIDNELPVKSITALLRESNIPIEKFGSLENPVRFVLNQFRMRL